MPKKNPHTNFSICNNDFKCNAYIYSYVHGKTIAIFVIFVTTTKNAPRIFLSGTRLDTETCRASSRDGHRLICWCVRRRVYISEPSTRQSVLRSFHARFWDDADAGRLWKTKNHHIHLVCLLSERATTQRDVG